MSRSRSSCSDRLRVVAPCNNARVATKAWVGMLAKRCAKVKAAAKGSSATSQIKPHSLACWAGNLSPVMAKASARGSPKRSTSNQLLPASGINPILLKA